MTVHNAATKGDIAKVVLFPGDPKRAELVASSFLKEAKEVSRVRGIPCFTGMYKEKRVSVMASGMGGASAGIYSYELFTEYEVDAIIRIGTAGGLQSQVQVGDIIFALSASTDSGWAHQYQLKGTLSPCVDPTLLLCAKQQAELLQYPHHLGMTFSSDLFSSYNALGEDSWKQWSRLGALVQDMETYALYCTAAWTKKRSLSILTMTDSCVTGEGLSEERRMSGLYPMIEVALETAYHYDL